MRSGLMTLAKFFQEPELPKKLKTKYIKVPRRLSPQIQSALRPFALSVGEFVWAYNLAQSRLGWFFNAMLRDTNVEVGRAIWLAMPFDSTQRQLLIAALESYKPRHKVEARLFKDVLWAANKIEKLSILRNDAVHMVTKMDNKKSQWEVLVEPGFTAAKRAARLQAIKDMNKAFSLARGDLNLLASYVGVRAIALFKLDEPLALQRRPRLLCHVTKNQA